MEELLPCLGAFILEDLEPAAVPRLRNTSKSVSLLLPSACVAVAAFALTRLRLPHASVRQGTLGEWVHIFGSCKKKIGNASVWAHAFEFLAYGGLCDAYHDFWPVEPSLVGAFIERAFHVACVGGGGLDLVVANDQSSIATRAHGHCRSEAFTLTHILALSGFICDTGHGELKMSASALCLVNDDYFAVVAFREWLEINCQ